MTGRRVCIDCPEFSWKPSQETHKSRFPVFWISWKVTSTQNGHWSHRLPPNWSAVVPEWSIVVWVPGGHLTQLLRSVLRVCRFVCLVLWGCVWLRWVLWGCVGLRWGVAGVSALRVCNKLRGVCAMRVICGACLQQTALNCVVSARCG